MMDGGELLASAATDPHRVLEPAVPPEPDDEVASAAGAIALAHIGDVAGASRQINAARRLATADGGIGAGALLDVAGAVLDHLAGDDELALRGIDAAVVYLAGSELSWALGQRSEINYRLGNFEQSQRDSEASASTAESVGAPLSGSRAVLTRSALHVRSGDPATARRRLEALRDSLLAHGHQSSAARALTALGKLERQSGNPDKALNFLEDAEELLNDLGHSVGEVWRERAAVLMASHMNAEAEQAAATVANGPDRTSTALARLDSLLISAQAALLAGRHEQARELAARTVELATHQRRAGWAAFGSYLGLKAREAGGGLAANDLAVIDRTADNLEEAGLHAEALRSRLIGSKVAAASGDVQGSHDRLRRAAESRQSPCVERAVLGWWAACLLRVAEGNTQGGAAAARAGIRLTGEYVAAYGTLAGLHVADAADQLADLGLQLAWASGSARRVFSWIELTRRGSRAIRSQQQPTNDEIKIGRIMLRQANDELRYAVLEGWETRHQEERRNRLQREVASLALAQLEGSVEVATPQSVLEQLGDASLVEFAEVGDTLVAVLLGGGRVRRYDLGSATRVRHQVDGVAVELRRLSKRIGSESSQSATQQTLEVATRELETALFGPMSLDGDHLVLVPSGATFAVPWSLLPGLCGSTIEVVPSAAMWLERTKLAMPRFDDVAVIAGPRLAHSVDEVNRVAAVYSRAAELVEPTAAAAARAIDGATVAHVACHGVFRVDNPFYSSLEMADGPLTVYDLEALGDAPDIVVLSACDAGTNTSSGGREVMGLATALLGQGTRCVIANVGLVPDQLTTIELMVDVHRGIVAGLTVARALAQALPDLDFSDSDRIAARAFVAFGA